MTDGNKNRNNSTTLSWLPECIDDYLNCLSKAAPTTTYNSHKLALSEFLEWKQSEATQRRDLEDHVVNFINYLIKDAENTIDTIGGYVSSLSNFLAYLNHDDPELVMARLLSRLQRLSEVKTTDLCEQVFGVLTSNQGPSGATREEIKHALSRLRQSRRGTRTHAYLETILATKARPESVRQLDLSNFNHEQKTLTIEIPNLFLVGKLDLVTSRKIELCDETVEILNEYVNYERKCSSEVEPLFTARTGRASSATLRRSTKQAVTTLTDPGANSFNDANTRTGPQENHSLTVLPSDIWWYALSGMLQ